MAWQWGNDQERWGAISKLLHWSTVALIFLQFWLAVEAANLPVGLAKLGTLARHKSVGITLLGLATLRLLWRISQSRSPRLPTNTPRWKRVLAGASHFGLYFLLFALPLTGWAMSSAKNYPVSWFNVVQLPDLVAPDEGAFVALRAIHHALAIALCLLIALHLAAALQHHFLQKDSVLLRMLPFRKS